MERRSQRKVSQRSDLVKIAVDSGNCDRLEESGSAQSEREPVPEKRTHDENDKGIERLREREERRRECDELNGPPIH